MKFTLTKDGKPIQAKDLTESEKIGFADKVLEFAGNSSLKFTDDAQRISFIDCLLAGANPHAFFNQKKKLLPERIYNACYAGDVTLPPPVEDNSILPTPAA